MTSRWLGSIGVVDAKGSQGRTVTQSAEYSDNAAWSPTGRRILYVGVVFRPYHGLHRTGIYVISSNGRNKHRVTSDSPPLDFGSSDSPPLDFGSKLAWSPDARSIVYVSARGGLYEVGVNGRGPVRLTSPHDDVLAPTWVAR
jgi:Tol biopolymer transport system component